MLFAYLLAGGIFKIDFPILIKSPHVRYFAQQHKIGIALLHLLPMYAPQFTISLPFVILFGGR